jgi:hypothetical protein
MRKLVFLFFLVSEPTLFSTRPPLFEIGAEVWALDKFHGCFTTLRSELLARNMQGRLSPIARLCGDLALLGDPVVFLYRKKKGAVFTNIYGKIHHSPTVSHFVINTCSWEFVLIAIYSSLTVFWPFGLFVTICSLFANRTYSYYRLHNLMNVDARFRVQALLELFCMFRILRGRLLSSSMR